MAGFGTEKILFRGPSGDANIGTDGGTASNVGSLGVVANTENGGVSAFNYTGTQYLILSGTTLAGTAPFSFGVWYKADAAAGVNAYFVSKNVVGAALYLNAGGPRFYVTGTPAAQNIGGGGALGVDHRGDGLWHLAVATWSPGVMSIYIDGVLAITSSASVPTSLSTGADNWGFGAQSSGGSKFFGLIDNMMVIPSELTLSQIAAWYTAGRGYDAATGNPAGILQLNTQSIRLGL
jgi:hypothetical protein